MGDGARGERLDLAFGAGVVGFFVPAREGREEEETDESEYDCDNTMIPVC